MSVFTRMRAHVSIYVCVYLFVCVCMILVLIMAEDVEQEALVTLVVNFQQQHPLQVLRRTLDLRWWL